MIISCCFVAAVAAVAWSCTTNAGDFPRPICPHLSSHLPLDANLAGCASLKTLLPTTSSASLGSLPVLYFLSLENEHLHGGGGGGGSNNHVRKETKKMGVARWLGAPESRGPIEHNHTQMHFPASDFLSWM